MTKIDGAFKGRDVWSDEQKAIGNRIKAIAWANDLGLKELHREMCKLKHVSASIGTFSHLLNGRVSSTFPSLVDAAVEVLAIKEDERVNRIDRSTEEEINFRKRQLKHYLMEGEDESDIYELHEIERRTREAAIARVQQQVANTGWQMYRYDWGDGLTNLEFNRKLVLSPPTIAVEIKEKEWLARDHWSPDVYGFIVRAARRKSRHLTNDRKIRVASDFAGRSSVILQPTRYFSSLATDQIAWSRFSTCKTKPDGSPEQVLWDGVSAFIDDRDGRLKGFDQCLVSNQLGASVMALTQDGEMLVVHQNKHNHQSEGRLAPSGSGSLDWEDVGERTDLLDIARFGAKRELEEECALTDKQGRYPPIACEVMLTGFVRMVHRAGKPEFFGIARIEGGANEICERKPERYVEKVFNAPIEKANWKRPASPQIARMCRSYLDHHSGSAGKVIPLSYPLQHILNHLIEVCEDPKRATVINAFMKPHG